MQKHQDSVLVNIGGATVPLSGATVLVYTADTLTLATIYSDNGVTAAINPLTTDSNGGFSFFAADGRYDLSITKTGYTTISVTDVLLEDALDEYASNTVASAAELTLLTDRDVQVVSGTTSITSIAAASAARGRRVTLVFQGVLTVTDGNNLKLAGNFTTSADDTITLACADGTNWYEMSRSVN